MKAPKRDNPKTDTRKKPVKIEEKRRKVAILGSATSTLGLCPWEDESLEIWGLAWRNLPRADRVFDLHPGNFDVETRKNVQKNYETRLKALKVPVYLCNEHPKIPNSVRYPIEAILKMMGPELDPFCDGQYFASSIAFLIALAIYEQVDEIHLYGLDFVADGEYEHQRPNTEYLIGIARGKGIQVFIPKGAAVCKFSYIYGYQLPDDPGILNRAVLLDRLKQYKTRHQKALDEARTADGAIQEVEQLLTTLIHVARGGKLEVPPMKDPVEVIKMRLDKEKEESHEKS